MCLILPKSPIWLNFNGKKNKEYYLIKKILLAYSNFNSKVPFTVSSTAMRNRG